MGLERLVASRRLRHCNSVDIDLPMEKPCDVSSCVVCVFVSCFLCVSCFENYF